MEVTHECPWYCHSCPQLDGGIMPFCTGQACRGDEYDDMWACTCPENEHLFEYVTLRPGDDELSVTLHRAAIEKLASL